MLLRLLLHVLDGLLCLALHPPHTHANAAIHRTLQPLPERQIVFAMKSQHLFFPRTASSVFMLCFRPVSEPQVQVLMVVPLRGLFTTSNLKPVHPNLLQRVTHLLSNANPDPNADEGRQNTRAATVLYVVEGCVCRTAPIWLKTHCGTACRARRRSSPASPGNRVLSKPRESPEKDPGLESCRKSHSFTKHFYVLESYRQQIHCLG